MAPIRGPAVPRRRLGAELRQLREKAGLLIEDVAEALECSPSKISRLENGKGIPKIRDVRDMLARFGVTDPKVRDRLLQWARAGQQQGWWQEFSDVTQQEAATAQLNTYIALEADASHSWEFQTNIVPGLLHTAGYARAILEAIPYDFGPTHVDRLVELRLRRQGVLFRDDAPLHFTCVIDEAVLLREVGGREVMVEQLSKIMDIAGRPNVDIRVLPLCAGQHAAVMSSFVLFEFADDSDRDIVNIEGVTGTVYLESEPDIRRYRAAMKDVIEKAGSNEISTHLIGSALDRLKQQVCDY